ncbi:hypothetical protein Pr1d_36690 [Bythopirellula goksoeyrii]|uniref:Uncharacterized protein n=1 Tax=Bythopirellula goksoeyrii TaxID=1400387 RepID=A0A5B9QFF1_9BACT|nr:hypothetical protein Pr1d_36690 [Bythopirellula goksoeyrii]
MQNNRPNRPPRQARPHSKVSPDDTQEADRLARIEKICNGNKQIDISPRCFTEPEYQRATKLAKTTAGN